MNIGTFLKQFSCILLYPRDASFNISREKDGILFIKVCYEFEKKLTRIHQVFCIFSLED